MEFGTLARQHAADDATALLTLRRAVAVAKQAVAEPDGGVIGAVFARLTELDDRRAWAREELHRESLSEMQ
ncbi:hypothetical protein FOZ76_14565 [Verticiella sediminum]|uniref:Uncharacterized protein n=1 Tax=Verticiella sediminum TaxID=1247510 RepID=A0A556AIC1_9BURK|nr:hypothetical protein [Verticiella sediminum]TSH92640.1 hypothetical protein FOZ76_14565 [Verticiella sediminum]